MAEALLTLGPAAAYDFFLANAAVRHFQARLAGISEQNHGSAPGRDLTGA